MKFSVIGYDEETGRSFLDHQEAGNAFAAMRDCARLRDTATIVCALPGHLTESAGEIVFAGEGVVDAQTILEQSDVFS